MKLSRRTNTIILWTISLGLLVSMVIAFTPSLGNLFSGGAQQRSQTALEVNGEDITELEVARLQQNPPFNLTLEGEAGDDLDALLVDSLVDNALIRQAAADTKVSRGEVNEAVNEFRQNQGVAGSRNDRNYLALIGRFGYDDASFRDFYREQLRVEKYQEGITEAIDISDEEVQAFYELNEQNYQSEERILARAIVLDNSEAADAAYERALAGEDFAALAEELSTERADRGGALGAAEGSSKPQPVGRAALPNEVANAAFGLGGSGLTEVISAGSSYYIVNVEEYVPAGTEPFEEVEEQVREDALAAKRAGELERTLEGLRAETEVSVPENSVLTLEDPVVATVGDEEIKRSELARAVYLNPQIQQSLSGGNAELITGLFKPSILDQLISQKLAYQGAQELGATFIGPEGQVAQSALAYVSRDAEATEEELSEYYETNQARFTIPAQAVVTRVDFDSEDAASGFRAALLDGEELQSATEDAGGNVLDLGTVRPGTLQPEIDTALFGTEAFTELPESSEEISDVLVISEPVEDLPDEGADPDADASDESSEEDTSEEAEDADATAEVADGEGPAEAAEAVSDETAEDTSADEAAEEAQTDKATESEAEVATEDIYVVLVAERTPERVRSFDEVRAQVEDTVLQTKRSELQTAWLDGLREDIPVENLLQAEADDAFETTPLGEGDADPENPEETSDESVDDGSSDAADDEATEEEIPEETGDEATGDEAAETAGDETSDATEETQSEDDE